MSPKDIVRFIRLVGGPVSFTRLRTAFSLTDRQARKLLKKAVKKEWVVVKEDSDA